MSNLRKLVTICFIFLESICIELHVICCEFEMVEELSKLESGFDSYDEEVLINFIEENTYAL